MIPVYTMPDIFKQESGNEIVTRNSPAHVTNHSTALVGLVDMR